MASSTLARRTIFAVRCWKLKRMLWSRETGRKPLTQPQSLPAAARVVIAVARRAVIAIVAVARIMVVAAKTAIAVVVEECNAPPHGAANVKSLNISRSRRRPTEETWIIIIIIIIILRIIIAVIITAMDIIIISPKPISQMALPLRMDSMAERLRMPNY